MFSHQLSGFCENEQEDCQNLKGGGGVQKKEGKPEMGRSWGSQLGDIISTCGYSF